MGKKKKTLADETHRTLAIGGLHRKAKSRNWYYRCTIDGKTMEYSTGTADIDEAEKVARARFMPIAGATQEEVLAGHVAAARKLKQHKEQLLLSDAWDVYSKHPDRAFPATKAEELSYKATFQDFCRIIGNPAILISEITFEHAEKFSNHLKTLSLAVDTHNRRIRQMRKIFKTLKDYLDGENPFASPALNRKSREDQNIGVRRTAFTKQQELQILDELSNPERQLINKEEIRIIYLIGMFTGQRLKDCVLLKWSKVDLKNMRVKVVQFKTGKQVILPIAAPLLDGLNEAQTWRENMPDSYVCPKTARRYNTLDSNGRNIGNQKVGVDVLRPIRWIGLKTSVKVEGRKKPITQYGFHSLRHSFVSFCAEAGVPKSVVMSFTGTDSEILDQYYTHVGTEQQRKALEAVANNLTRKSDEERITEALAFIKSQPESEILTQVIMILTA